MDLKDPRKTLDQRLDNVEGGLHKSSLLPFNTEANFNTLTEASLDSLVRLRNLQALINEAHIVLPEFPVSLNLVIWAAYNLSEVEFAGEIRGYLESIGCLTTKTINATDTEEDRTCKALASAVRHRAGKLAIDILKHPSVRVTKETVKQAATYRMLDLLKELAMRNIPLHLAEEKLSMMSAIRQKSHNRSPPHMTWDLLYKCVVQYCTETEITTVLNWNCPIQHFVSPLCIHSYFDIAISLVIRRKAELHTTETLEILESGNIKFLTKLEKSLKPLRPKFLYNSEVCEALALLLTKPHFLLDAVYLIRKIPVKHLTTPNLAHITRTLRTLLTLHSDNTLIEHWNPILVSIACAELCGKFAVYHFEFKHSFEQMRTKFKALANSYVKKFSEFRKVHLIYTDDSYPGGTLLDITTNKSAEYRMMLSSEIVAAVVEHLWSGNAKTIKMHLASPLFHIYKAKHPDKVFEIHRSKKMLRPVDCYLSFSSWKQSAEMRFWMETLYLMVVLIRLIVTIRIFAKSNLVIYDWAEDPQDRLDAIDTLEAEKLVMWLCFGYFLAFQVRIVFDLIFQRLNRQKFKVSKRSIIDLGLFSFTLAGIEKIENHPDELDNIENIFAVIMMLICVKACLIMLITRQFGPVLRSIGIIVMNAFKYIILFLLSILAFSLVFYVLFYRQDEQFETIGSSFTVLFNFSAGNLDFNIFGDRHDLGAFLTCLWTFVSMVTLLNIIVAFITNSYSSMEPQANADYASLLYTSYKATKYNEAYSALVMFPVPTNMFIAVISPAFWIIPNTAKINHLLMALSYVQMFILALGLFTLYNIVMIPVAFLRTALRLLRFFQHDRQYWWQFIKWVILGPFYLAYLSVLSYRFVIPVLLESKIRPVHYELSSEMLEETLRVAKTLSKDQELPVIVPLDKIMQHLTEPDSQPGFIRNLRVAQRRMTTRASLFKNVIKDYHLCNHVEFIEQFLWYEGFNSEQQVNLTLLTKMIEELAFNSARLIPVNVSGIQRALMRFKKKKF